MVWFGFEPGAEEWKSQKNPLSYGGTPNCSQILKIRKNNHLAFFNFSKIRTKQREGLIGMTFAVGGALTNVERPTRLVRKNRVSMFTCL